MTNYAKRHEANEASRLAAGAHREIWEAWEIELLEEGWDDDGTTLPEIAELLERTIEACRQKHYELAMQKTRTQRTKHAKSTNNSTWDRGWTSLEDMGF